MALPFRHKDEHSPYDVCFCLQWLACCPSWLIKMSWACIVARRAFRCLSCFNLLARACWYACYSVNVFPRGCVSCLAFCSAFLLFLCVCVCVSVSVCLSVHVRLFVCSWQLSLRVFSDRGRAPEACLSASPSACTTYTCIPFCCMPSFLAAVLVLLIVCLSYGH